MSHLDHVVLEQTHEEGSDYLDRGRDSRPLNGTGQISIIFSIEIHVERLSAICHNEDLLESVKYGHRNL